MANCHEFLVLTNYQDYLVRITLRTNCQCYYYVELPTTTYNYLSISLSTHQPYHPLSIRYRLFPFLVSMGLTLRRVLRFLHMYPRAKDQYAGSGPFEILPLEMIQYIASFLPSSAAAAFALCNHYLRYALGAQYWMELREPRQRKERELFLQLLDRDLLDHVFCHHCARLHLSTPPGMGDWDDVQLYNRMRLRRCYDEEMRARTYFYYPHTFRFENVQMAMKLHRLGLDTKKYLEALSHVERTSYPLPHVEIFHARIVSDEMIIRAQHWFYLIPDGPILKLSREVSPCPRVCAHLQSSLHYIDDNTLTKLLHCKVRHINKKQDPCTQCTGLTQCRYCPTEMQIDVKMFRGWGTALVVTKWLAVGSGESPQDPKWLSHLQANDIQTIPAFPFKAGTIKEAFEQQANFNFESPLTPKIAEQLLVFDI